MTDRIFVGEDPSDNGRPPMDALTPVKFLIFGEATRLPKAFWLEMIEKLQYYGVRNSADSALFY